MVRRQVDGDKSIYLCRFSTSHSLLTVCVHHTWLICQSLPLYHQRLMVRHSICERPQPDTKFQCLDVLSQVEVCVAWLLIEKLARHSAYSFIFKFLKSLNYQHELNFAVVHNLYMSSVVWLIVNTFLASKRPLSMTVKAFIK